MLAMLLIAAVLASMPFTSIRVDAQSSGNAESGAGYVVFAGDLEEDGAYVPPAGSQFNSSDAENTIQRTDVGNYLVTMPELSGGSGHVQVDSVFGDGTQSCNVVNWVAAESDVQIHVRCFDNAGSPVDAHFMALFLNVNPDDDEGDGADRFYAYLWAQDATSDGPYAADPGYSYNSSGAENTVERGGVGAYTAVLPGFTGDGGLPHVTAYGDQTVSCNAFGWSKRDESTLVVDVLCFDAAGAPADSRFTLFYQKETADSDAANDEGIQSGDGYLWAGEPTAETSYAPDNQYNSSGQENTVDRLDVGRYVVTFPGLSGEGGFVLLTETAGAGESCTVTAYGATDSGAFVEVSCFDAAGSPIDLAFNISFQTA